MAIALPTQVNDVPNIEGIGGSGKECYLFLADLNASLSLWAWVRSLI